MEHIAPVYECQYVICNIGYRPHCTPCQRAVEHTSYTCTPWLGLPLTQSQSQKTKHIRIRCLEHDDFIEIGGVICKTSSAWIEWRVTVPEQRHAAQETNDATYCSAQPRK